MGLAGTFIPVDVVSRKDKRDCWCVPKNKELVALGDSSAAASSSAEGPAPKKPKPTAPTAFKSAPMALKVHDSAKPLKVSFAQEAPHEEAITIAPREGELAKPTEEAMGSSAYASPEQGGMLSPLVAADVPTAELATREGQPTSDDIMAPDSEHDSSDSEIVCPGINILATKENQAIEKEQAEHAAEVKELLMHHNNSYLPT